MALFGSYTENLVPELNIRHFWSHERGDHIKVPQKEVGGECRAVLGSVPCRFVLQGTKHALVPGLRGTKPGTEGVSDKSMLNGWL